MECPKCWGSGKVSYWRNKPCKRCKGKGKIGANNRRRRKLRGKARKYPASVLKRKRRRAL